MNGILEMSWCVLIFLQNQHMVPIVYALLRSYLDFWGQFRFFPMLMPKPCSIKEIISFENYNNYFGKLFGANFQSVNWVNKMKSESENIMVSSGFDLVQVFIEYFKPRLLSTGLRRIFMPNDCNFSGHHVISLLEQLGTLCI